MSASAVVLTNLESIYVTGPGGSEDAIATVEYPDAATCSTFNYSQISHEGMHGAEIPPTGFGTLIDQKGATQGQNIGHDSNTFQLLCADRIPRRGFVAVNSNPYRYIHPPYVYTPVVGSSPHVIHYRGVSEPNKADDTPYSPYSVQHGQPYMFADERHTYHDLSILADTMRRQRRSVGQFEQVAPPTVTSPLYGRLRQPAGSYTIAFPNNRQTALNARMAPDGEVTSLMESATTLKRVKLPITSTAKIDFTSEVERGKTSDEDENEDFDEGSEPNPPSEAETGFEGDTVGDEEEMESITDPNAKLILSKNEQTQTLKKVRNERRSIQTQQHHQHESENQSTEEMLETVESGFPSSIGDDTTHCLSTQMSLTYAVHEASFV